MMQRFMVQRILFSPLVIVFLLLLLGGFGCERSSEHILISSHTEPPEEASGSQSVLNSSSSASNITTDPLILVWTNHTYNQTFNETFNYTAYLTHPDQFIGQVHSLIGFTARVLDNEGTWRYYMVDDLNQSLEVQRNFWKGGSSDTWESGADVFKTYFPEEGASITLYNVTGEMKRFAGKPLIVAEHVEPYVRQSGVRVIVERVLVPLEELE